MFEFDKSVPDGPRSAAPPVDTEKAPAETKKRAHLVWGEHCTECAAPDCYSSCSLYDPRPDGRCRRFEFGALPNTGFPVANGTAAEIKFRRWGRLMAKGNTLLMPNWLAGVVARLVLLISPVFDAVGKVAARLSGDPRWSHLGYHLTDRFAGLLSHIRARNAHYSLDIEIYNPTESEIELLLSISIDRSRMPDDSLHEELPAPFLRKIHVPPGHFSDVIPGEVFNSVSGSGLPFEIALDPLQEGAHLVFLRLDLVECAAPIVETDTRQAPEAKCVVFDLDETLWDGVLIEGDVKLRAGIRELFQELDRRGILLSVASKNDPDEALAQLRSFGLEEYLLHPAIGWRPKSEGVAAIAKRLDIGADTLLFVDDNPFERAEVEEAVAGVVALPDTALPGLLDHLRLTGGDTSESRVRRRIYKEAANRTDAAESFVGDYEGFLRASEVRVEIRPDRPEDGKRIHELVQRTNQLNFSGHKYSRKKIEPLLSDPARDRYVVRCSDRFGDYGLVGFCLTRTIGNVLRIEDLMLSCRVQGRMIERALLDHLVNRPGWSGNSVEIVFVDTERNGPARAVLDELGFDEARNNIRRRQITRDSFSSDVVTVTGSHADDLVRTAAPDARLPDPS